MNRFSDQWVQLEQIFVPAVDRLKHPDLSMDWEMLEQVTFGGGVAAGCAILETAGLKGKNDHVKLLFELRNAFIHNQCDIAKNRDENAYLMAKEYLEKDRYKEISPNLAIPFFRLKGTIIEFDRSIFIVIRLLLL